MRSKGLVLIFLGLAIGLLKWTSHTGAQANGLVAAYGFNEGSGGVVVDSSGNNLTGTIVGASWTTQGKYANALSFNGTSNYIDLGNPAALQLTGSMTIEAWINAAANPPDDGQIVAKANDTSGWQFKTSPDTGPHTFGVGVTNSSGMAQRYSSSTRSLNTWYHVAGVYNASTSSLDIYVNGGLNNGTLRGTIAANQLNSAVNVNIGRRTGGYYFNGLIDEVRIYNRALSAAEVVADMNTPIGGTPPPDTIPPSVSINTPTDGAPVTGTITVSATASDNNGVAGVQFLLDGAALGSEALSAPFSTQWNTALATLGSHTLTAVARDFAGNTSPSAPVTVTVSNPTPAQIGQWSAVANWPTVAVHAVLLTTGNVLAWTDYTINEGAQIWRPATNTFTAVPWNSVNLFCAGHAYMADGRLMVVGGTLANTDDYGPRDTTFFDPVTEKWSAGPLMLTGRYYPTLTTMPDGRLIVQGGTVNCVSCVANNPEIYNPATNAWTQINSPMPFRYYPHSFVLPDGRILVTSQDDQAISSKVLNLQTNAWSTVDPAVRDGHSAVMYVPGKVMKAGTATSDNPGHPSAATTYVMDATQPSPVWQATAPMANPRSFLNLTMLPDGQVLATGGSTTTDPANFSTAVYPAEIWSPTTMTWTTLASMQKPRLYHSTAVLLPDARVLVAGGGRQNGRSQPDPKDQPNAEIFSPPYLFKGPRPVISSAPSLIPYGNTFFVATPDGARVASAALIPPAAVTHAFNENQRFVPLTFQVVANGLNIQGPANSNIAPPGPYMLFLVDTNGVPSVAPFVRLPAPGEDSQSPTAPSGLSASASLGSVALTWSASTDNVGVTGYNVHRELVSGFTPSTANRIGQTAATSFTDTAFTSSGTYYYRVTAQDARGNVSAPSNDAVATVTLDTAAPTVAITSPANNSTVSGSVTLTATATDNVAVSGVQFLLDGANLGAENSGPGPSYSFSWTSTTVANGVHTLSARARDGAGNSSVASVSLTVANAAPSGLVAAYSFNEGSGSTVTDVSGHNITGTISGAAWTAGGRYGNALVFNGSTSFVDLGNPAALQLTGSMTIEAWINATANPPDDGQIVAKSNDTSGWQFKTSPDTGPHTFGMGLRGSSGLVQRYSSTVRSLNTWYHVAGVYNAAAGTLDTYVNGNIANGTLSGVIPASQLNSTVNVNIGRRTGGYYFNGIIDEIRIYNRALSQAEVAIDMNTPVGGTPPPNDTTPPIVSLTSPVGGATVSGAVSVAASASDDVSMAGVQFLLDGAGLGAEVSGPGPSYTLNWTTTTASNGTHTLAARARDAANNTTTSPAITVTVSNVDSTPPTVSLTAPSNGATVTGTTVISATATDNTAIAGVQFLLDGANLGSEVAGSGPGFTFNWNTTTVSIGSHTLAARARDTANNTTTTPAITVTVAAPDTVPPSVSLTAPASGAAVSGSVVLTATAIDNAAMAGVTFLLDGASLGTEVAGSGPNYSYTWNTATASNGAHTLSARARDSANNTAVATNVGVTVANTAPGGVLVSYSFNQGSGTTAPDGSGNGVTGTISGATWTADGKYGNALAFNGSNAYVNLGTPAVLSGTGNMSWTAWVKATATPADDGQIIAKSNNSNGWQFKTSPDTGPHTFAIGVSSGGAFAQRNSSTIRALNTWYHVAGVYNATTRTLDIYVNGVLDNGILSGTVPASMTVPNVAVNIGRRSGGYYFAGVIDDLRVYNRALSQAEIQAIMNTPLP